jgi:hypothetical protein
MNGEIIKKDYSYVWIALILSLFFWVPILNIVAFLPAAMYFSTKQIGLAKYEPEKYGRVIYPAIIFAHSIVSMIFSLLILIISTRGLL